MVENVSFINDEEEMEDNLCLRWSKHKESLQLVQPLQREDLIFL